MKQRYRSVGIAYRGGLIAYVRDNETGETIPIRRRLGRWRNLQTDETVERKAAACARRALQGADINQLQRQRVRGQEADSAVA